MGPGTKRTLVARLTLAGGGLCGVVGLMAGFLGRTWKLTPFGWFDAGVLLVLIALVVLLDGTMAFQKSRMIGAPKS